jgi:phage tail sheath protein FI
MPEYLAPGVYVEEIDTGNKPIEGVSTSTTGMVGVTERGPVDVPILVTSYGEYTRWFGERLNILEYSNPNGPNCYLPHAAEGFFTNGGKRLFVTRVLDVAAATRALFGLHDRADTLADPATTFLLRPAGELTGGAGQPIYVMNVNDPVANALDDGDRIRIGDGSDAEYRTVATPNGVGAAADTTHVPVDFAVSRTQTAGGTVHQIARTVLNPLTLGAAAEVGDTIITLTGAAADVAAVVDNDLLEIGTQFASEHRYVRGVPIVDSATQIRVTLDSGLALPHDNGSTVSRLDNSVVGAVDDDSLDVDANAGDRFVFVVNRAGNFDDRTTLLIINNGDTATREARRIGDLTQLSLATGAYGEYDAASVIAGVTMADDGAVAAKALTADAAAGSSVVALDNRVDLNVGDVIRVGVAPNDEYLTIAALPNPSPGNAPPNAGNVVLTHGLGRRHTTGDVVRRQTAPAINAARPSSSLVLATTAGSQRIAVTDGTGFALNEFVRVGTDPDAFFYHRLSAAAVDLDARAVTLTVPLSFAHGAGSSIAEREPLLNIQALDAGAWGNRLRVSVQDEPAGLVSRTTVQTVVDPNHIRLRSAAGVEAGTILEIVDQTTGVRVGDLLKVTAIDRATNYTITLAGAGMSGPQSAPGLIVRSREFQLTVYLLRQPDPALPSRNENILNTEFFRNLSMDPRHSRYIANVVGDVNGVLRIHDRRPEGESWFVRVEDLAPDQATLESIRLGPEPLVDILPNGRRRAARHALSGGNDSLGTLTDATYIGIDDIEPELRTGLFSMRNIEEISLVSIPGQISPAIQGALIDHCELMRYRFCVLDGMRPPDDTLTDVQTQRQQFDTKYAALYHPWLLIPDPYPTNLAHIPTFPIPPSGHMLGIYARTDIDRGVHKAPANEVVRGILGLQRTLTKGEHDILNPYPVNINVIRDFRDNNRGIRVYGGRVITSDSDWKYVNVRRLLIFIEHSLDRGLQWVVFEPNAEPLWARVVRTVSDFLTVVWRNGALEGTRVEEAFFVKCDRTTMTQNDIDNGRLICVIGVAPVKPAEFVIIRIGLWTAHAEV